MMVRVNLLLLSDTRNNGHLLHVTELDDIIFCDVFCVLAVYYTGCSK